MSRYQVTTRQEAEERVYVLEDTVQGLRAELVPGIGAQCFRLQWTHQGVIYDLLRSPENLEALREEPIQYGIPVLFPFPNRIAGGQFTFEGQQVRLPITEPERGNAIHGLVLDAPWSVALSGADEHCAFVLCTLSSEDHPQIHNVFPYPFRVEYELCLAEGRLITRFRAQNTGQSTLPMGYGIHPWFPAPISPHGDRRQVRIQGPVTKVWELEHLLPTGRTLNPNSYRNLEPGVALGDLSFDDVYTGVSVTGPWESKVTDPAAGVEIVVRSAPNLRELVIYSTPDQPIVCLEPYSCTTNAVNLEAEGVPTGLVRLEPGKHWETYIEIFPQSVSTNVE